MRLVRSCGSVTRLAQSAAITSTVRAAEDCSRCAASSNACTPFAHAACVTSSVNARCAPSASLTISAVDGSGWSHV